MTRLLAVVLVVTLTGPAMGQPADAPVPPPFPAAGTVTAPADTVTVTIPSNYVILTSEKAKEVDLRLSVAEAKLAVYEAHPPLPTWAVVLVAAAGVLVGAGVTVGVYELARRP